MRFAFTGGRRASGGRAAYRAGHQDRTTRGSGLRRGQPWAARSHPIAPKAVSTEKEGRPRAPQTCSPAEGSEFGGRIPLLWTAEHRTLWMERGRESWGRKQPRGPLWSTLLGCLETACRVAELSRKLSLGRPDGQPGAFTVSGI